MGSFHHHQRHHLKSSQLDQQDSTATRLLRPKQLGEDVRKPPKDAGQLALSLWRLQLWFECTFGLTVMEPWERMAVLTLFAIVSLLVCTGLVRFFPQNLVGLQRRTMYYLWGHAEEMPAIHLHLP